MNTNTAVFSNKILRNSLVVLVVMMVPIVPFLIFGEQSEAWFQNNIIDRADFSPVVTAGAVIAALVADILLPVPSSAVLTYAGSVFGIIKGIAVGWIGLTLSCVLGFWLGRRFGVPLLLKISSEEELNSSAVWLNRFGPWMLAVVRGLPVLGEAFVLLAGAYRMSPRKFWPPVVIANLALATIYSVLGHTAGDEGKLGVAIMLSLVMPLLLLMIWVAIVRKYFPDREIH